MVSSEIFGFAKKRYGVKYVLVYMNPYSVSSEAVYALQERAELVFPMIKEIAKNTILSIYQQCIHLLF